MLYASRCVLLWLLSTCLMVCQAREVVATGSAPVRDGDVGQARELAVRRAMARAAESESALVSSRSVVGPGMVTEATQVRATACTGSSQLVKEARTGDELTVTLAVTVLEPQLCAEVCPSGYVNKLVVTDFGFEFPSQLFASEREHLKYKTAAELARAIRKGKRLLTGFEPLFFPYVSAEAAPEPYMGKAETETPFARVARSHRGQYVLSGVYRDMGVRADRSGRPVRHMEVEAFLHDGGNGALLDRQSFAVDASGMAMLSEINPIGSPSFYQSDFGRAWGNVLDRVARWAEAKVTCLPFISRVIKVEGDQVYIDAGAESGLSVGDTLNLHIWRNSDVRSSEKTLLGTEKRLGATVSLRSLYPQFAVLQVLQKHGAMSEIKTGDLVYSQ